MCDGNDDCGDNSDEEEGCKLWKPGKGIDSMFSILVVSLLIISDNDSLLLFSRINLKSKSS